MPEQLKSSEETVLWKFGTNRLLYTIGSPFLYVFALIWGAFDFFFISQFFRFGASDSFSDGPTFSFNFVMLPFFLIHLLPVWFAIISPIYRFFAAKNIEYMITDLRVYMVSGIFGRDVTSIEYREIAHLTVNVNPIENMMGLGTIQLTPDGTVYHGSRDGRRVSGKRLLHISEPYKVYNMLKQLSLDVTTDQQYPNAFRPNDNPGYKTKYRP